MKNQSMRTVAVSVVAGFAVALTKLGAAVITGSSAMAAEAAHSFPDAGHDLFLLVAQRRGARDRDDRHPLGYGREAYFWSLLAAVGVLVAGAAFSLRDGIDELIHPSVTSSFAVAYVVLAISTVFDLLSLQQSGSQIATLARRAIGVVHESGDAADRPADRNDKNAERVHLGPIHDPDDVRPRTGGQELQLQDLFNQSAVTSDPTARAVFNEDLVAISSDALAFVGLALNQITGSSIPQGVAAVLIGLLIIRAGLRLVARGREFLVGQPLQPTDEARLRAFLFAYPGVAAVRELIATFVGPGQVWVVARLEIADQLRGGQVESLVAGIESAAKHESEQTSSTTRTLSTESSSQRTPISERSSRPGADLTIGDPCFGHSAG
jgi:cation diffusion facilitator family transporter